MNGDQRPVADHGPGPFEGPTSYPQLCWWSLICMAVVAEKKTYNLMIIPDGLDHREIRVCAPINRETILRKTGVT
jgi:hypothetical protein